MSVSDELKNRILSALRTPEARDELDAILNAGSVADGGIHTAKLADGSVTAPKLASDSVTTAKIVDANVTLAKLASGVVPSALFSPGTSGDWSPVPTTIQEALDDLAAEIFALEATGPAAVNLLTAGNYGILSKSGISTTAGTSIVGDIAVSPIAATAITGFDLTLDGGGAFSTSALVTGEVFAADYAAPTPANLTQAVTDMEAAYTDAAGRTSPNFTNLGAGNIGGLTLVPGLYKWTTGITIPNDVTLSGSSSSVFIFQVAGTMSLSNAKNIIFSGGVLPSNVFWQVSGAVTLGTTSVFRGIMLGATSVAVQTGATVHGQLYAQTAVTLDSNTITES